MVALSPFLALFFACGGHSTVERPVGAAAVTAPTKRRITVDIGGTGDFTSIMDAIKDSDSGDEIWVMPGTYAESVHFTGRSVAVRSTDGAAVTFLTPPAGESAVEADDGESVGTVLAGFTISGGSSAEARTVEAQFSALTIEDCIITGNSAPIIVYAHSGHLVVNRTTIEGNTAAEGMVVQNRRGMTVLKDSTLRCGTTAVGYMAEHGAAQLDGATVDCPGLRAVEIFHTPGRIQRTVIDGLLYVENEGAGGEGTVVEGSLLKAGAEVLYSDLTLRNVVSLAGVKATESNLVVDSSVISGGACGVWDVMSETSLTYNDFWNNTKDLCGGPNPVGSNGNIDADPLFVDATGGDYTLTPESPCRETGSVRTDDADPDGTRNDMGAYGGPFSLGGGW
jgi:hypothetical protein